MGNAAKVSGWEETRVSGCDMCGKQTSYKDGWIDVGKSVFLCDSCRYTEEGSEYNYENERKEREGRI